MPLPVFVGHVGVGAGSSSIPQVPRGHRDRFGQRIAPAVTTLPCPFLTGVDRSRSRRYTAQCHGVARGLRPVDVGARGDHRSARGDRPLIPR